MPMPELLVGSLFPAGGLQHWAEAFLTLIGDRVETNPPQGYVLIGLALLLENVVPPIPSELVMPLSGFLVQQGKLQLVPVVGAVSTPEGLLLPTGALRRLLSPSAQP